MILGWFLPENHLKAIHNWFLGTRNHPTPEKWTDPNNKITPSILFFSCHPTQPIFMVHRRSSLLSICRINEKMPLEIWEIWGKLYIQPMTVKTLRKIQVWVLTDWALTGGYIIRPDSKNKKHKSRFFFYFAVPPTHQKRIEIGTST